MLMNKNQVILHDFDPKRNDIKNIKKGNLLISDYSFSLCDNLDTFIKTKFKEIPSPVRCFAVIYDFNNNIFYINNSLHNNKFIKTNLDKIA